MLGGVGQRFGDDVVGSDLDGFGKPTLDVDVDADRHHRASCECPQRRSETTLGQNRRMDAARQFLQVGVELGQAVDDVVELLAHGQVGGRHRGLDRPQPEAKCHDPLLCPVVQIAFEPPPGLIRRGHDACPGCLEFSPRLGIGDRGGDEIGEVADARLGSGWHRPRAYGTDDQRASRFAVDGHGCADAGTEAEAVHPGGNRARHGRIVVDPGRLAGLPNRAAQAVAIHRESFSDVQFRPVGRVVHGQHQCTCRPRRSAPA